MKTKTMQFTNPQYRKLNRKGTDTYFELLDELHRYTFRAEKQEFLFSNTKYTDIANIVNKYLHRLAHNHNQIKPCENCNHSVTDQH